MDTELEQYYCITCDKLFNDIARKPYYTRNNFCDNQIHLIYGLKRKHEMKQPNYHAQCPHCYSINNIKVKLVLLTLNKDKGANNKAGFNQYNKGKAKLYKKVLEKIEATKHLNTANDK